MLGSQINFQFLLKKRKGTAMYLVGRTIKGQEEPLSFLGTGQWQRDFYLSAASAITCCMDWLCAVVCVE